MTDAGEILVGEGRAGAHVRERSAIAHDFAVCKTGNNARASLYNRRGQGWPGQGRDWSSSLIDNEDAAAR